MIGTALSHKEQTNIVRKLHKVDIPWNCPHGRVSIITSVCKPIYEAFISDIVRELLTVSFQANHVPYPKPYYLHGGR